MENRRLHKLGTKLLLISIGVLLIIAGSIFIYFQVFYTKSYGCVFSDNRIENGFNNEQANLNSRLWQIGDNGIVLLSSSNLLPALLTICFASMEKRNPIQAVFTDVCALKFILNAVRISIFFRDRSSGFFSIGTSGLSFVS